MFSGTGLPGLMLLSSLRASLKLLPEPQFPGL